MVAATESKDGGGLCLSEDLIMEILSRLPMYSLISCFDFISKQITSKMTMKHLTPIVLASESLENRPMYGSFICGPCDGIYYLFNGYDGERKCAFWNPVTNEHKALPPVVVKCYCSKEYEAETVTLPASLLQTDSWTYFGDLSKFMNLICLQINATDILMEAIFGCCLVELSLKTA
ncbi:hypothetical protein RDABS01_010467, partial [Bienertia sinuspersici]